MSLHAWLQLQGCICATVSDGWTVLTDTIAGRSRKSHQVETLALLTVIILLVTALPARTDTEWLILFAEGTRNGPPRGGCGLGPPRLTAGGSDGCVECVECVEASIPARSIACGASCLDCDRCSEEFPRRLFRPRRASNRHTLLSGKLFKTTRRLVALDGLAYTGGGFRWTMMTCASSASGTVHLVVWLEELTQRQVRRVRLVVAENFTFRPLRHRHISASGQALTRVMQDHGNFDCVGSCKLTLIHPLDAPVSVQSTPTCRGDGQHRYHSR